MPGLNFAWRRAFKISTNFHDIHRTIIVLNALVGFCVPALSQSSMKTYSFLYFNSRVIIAATVVHSFCLLLGIRDLHHNITSLCSNVVVLSLSFFNIYIATYFIMNKGRFSRLILSFDQLARLCDEDPLSKLDFSIRLYRNVKIFVLFSSLIPLFVFFLTLVFFILAYVQGFTLAIMWFPCEYIGSPCFNITFILNAVMTIIYSMQKLSYELFMMSMFLWMRSFFEHLNCSLENVFVQKNYSKRVKQNRAICKSNISLDNECLSVLCDANLMTNAVVFSSKTKKYHNNSVLSGVQDSFSGRKSDSDGRMNTTEMRLQQWTELHQNVLRLGDDFSQLHSPMFTAYLAHIICLITLSCFFASESSNDLIRDIALVISLFGVATLGLMCVIGDTVAQESQDVAEEVYWQPWYNASKAAKSSLLIILARTHKAYEASSPFAYAKLNKETFVSLCNLVLSYYLALDNMKQVKKSQP